jgi:hypothetical protein
VYWDFTFAFSGVCSSGLMVLVYHVLLSLSRLWQVQGYAFCSNMRVVPQNSYDLILGMDWLKSYSPMQVHWTEKWMLLPYQGTQMLL